MDTTMIRYEFVTGEITYVKVTSEIAEVLRESRMAEHACNERERYHSDFSLDSDIGNSKEALLSSGSPEDALLASENRQHLLNCLSRLTSVQQERLLLYAQGKSIAEIARIQHTNPSAVRESIDAAKKKFKKIF